jgi:putative membrane protein
MAGGHAAMRRSRRRGSFQRQIWIGAGLALSLGAATATAQTAIPPSAKDFALAATQSDQYEIEAGWVAVTQSQNPRVRAFAQQMIDAHTRTQQDICTAATASGLAPPPLAMSSDQAALLSALQSLRGTDFDQAYARQQVLAHDQALAVEQSYAAAGTDPNLTALARVGTPLIQHHLEMAQQIRSALGGS